MAYLSISKVKCNQTSGGQIQFMVGDKSILPSYTAFNGGDELTFESIVDLGQIIGATISINLYDTRFSDDQSIHSVAVNNTLTVLPSPIRPFNYNKNKWSDEIEKFVRVRGSYDVTYQLIDTPGGVIRIYALRLAKLVVELITFTILFLRNLFLSIALFFRSLFRKTDDQVNLK